MTPLEDIIAAILTIKGDKIVTIATTGHHQAYDINAKGDIGYAPFHRHQFETQLAAAFRDGGGVIIRQFLTIKVECVMPNGKKMWIPRKNVYGISIVDGEWFGIPESALIDACCTDNVTGKRLPIEPHVSYKAFPTSAWDSEVKKTKAFWNLDGKQVIACLGLVEEIIHQPQYHFKSGKPMISSGKH